MWDMALECSSVGFFGVIVILHPGRIQLNGTIYAVIGVITYSLTALTARKLSEENLSISVSIYLSARFCLVQ